MLDASLLLNFATALLIGTLIGIEREKRKREDADPRGGGLRTFILVALLGAVAGHLTSSVSAFGWVLPGALIALAVLLVAGYRHDAGRALEGLGMTSEMAALGVFLLGAMCAHGQRALAVGLGIVVATVLAYKQPMHRLVEKLGWEDVFAGLRLLIATFIVLPLLPDRAIDPWQALNPYRLWLLVLLIAGLSLAGYVATRWLGEGRGAAITGITGGLVSSTAVTLSFARQSRVRDQSAAVRVLACGVMLAWCVMFLRVLVEVLVVNRELLPRLLPPFLAMGMSCAVLAGWLYWHGRSPHSSPAEESQAVSLKNPFSLLSAVSFGLLFAAILLIVKLVQLYLPGQGQYVVAALAGFTEVDAITLSMADYARSGDASIASNAIVIAAISNTVCKSGMLLVLGGKHMRRIALLSTLLIFVAGAAGMMLG